LDDSGDWEYADGSVRDKAGFGFCSAADFPAALFPWRRRTGA
jgi:hypothetical protein